MQPLLDDHGRSLPESTKVVRLRVFWALLNSSVGLWVLSSITVGGATFAYTVYSQSRTERLARERQIDRLRLELDLRFYMVGTRIRNRWAAHSKNGYSPPDDGPDAASRMDFYYKFEQLPLILATPDSLESLHPDYEKRNARSLLSEYYSLIQDPVERANVAKCMFALSIESRNVTIKPDDMNADLIGKFKLLQAEWAVTRALLFWVGRKSTISVKPDLRLSYDDIDHALITFREIYNVKESESRDVQPSVAVTPK